MRIYVDGVFDLFHAGHISYLKRVRDTFGAPLAFLEPQPATLDASSADGALDAAPGALDAAPVTLVVGVISDADACWKREPIMTLPERLAVVQQCRLVDEVVAASPLIVDAAFLAAHRIDFVAHADDDAQTQYFATPIAMGIMRYIPYTKGISTTEIIARVAAHVAARDAARDVARVAAHVRAALVPEAPNQEDS